jgi:hypothetical protein
MNVWLSGFFFFAFYLLPGLNDEVQTIDTRGKADHGQY